MGFQTPQPKRKRLCRLFSSVVLFSATNEDYEYRVYRPHLGVETRSSFQSQCHAIETLAMQPRRAAEEPNSVGAPRGATTPTQVYPVYPPSLITRVTSQPLQELDACSDGVAIPVQPELVNIGASKGRAHDACIDGVIVSGQPELVNFGASAC